MRYYRESELLEVRIQELLDKDRIEMLTPDKQKPGHALKLRITNITFYIKKGLQHPLKLMLFSNNGDVLVPNTPMAQICYTVDPYTEITTRLTPAGSRVTPLPKGYDFWNMMTFPMIGAPFFPVDSNWEDPDQGCNYIFNMNFDGKSKGVAKARYMI